MPAGGRLLFAASFPAGGLLFFGDDSESFEAKMQVLATTLRGQQSDAAKLDSVIAAHLKELGYGE